METNSTSTYIAIKRMNRPRFTTCKILLKLMLCQMTLSVDIRLSKIRKCQTFKMVRGGNVGWGTLPIRHLFDLQGGKNIISLENGQFFALYFFLLQPICLCLLFFSAVAYFSVFSLLQKKSLNFVLYSFIERERPAEFRMIQAA